MKKISCPFSYQIKRKKCFKVTLLHSDIDSVMWSTAYPAGSKVIGTNFAVNKLEINFRNLNYIQYPDQVTLKEILMDLWSRMSNTAS